MSVVRLAVRRALIAIPMLFGIATVTFLVTHVLPGDPIRAIAGEYSTPELLEQLRRQYGMDKPVLTQYWTYITDVVTLDFGDSMRTGRPVRDELVNLIPSTLELIFLTLVVALAIGVPAGALAALRRGGAADKLTRIGSSILVAVPEFWLALVALYVFFFILGVAPAPVGQIGITDPRPEHVTGAMVLDSAIALDWRAFRASAHYAMLPVLTFGLVLSAPFARLMRSSMIEVLEADYIRFGRSCGLPGRVLWRYAVRSALPSVVTMTGILFTGLLGGAVLVETIFSWNGAAQYAGSAILQNDYNAIQGFVLVVGVVCLIVFFLVDLTYMIIDPRIRLGPVATVRGSWSARGTANRARMAMTALPRALRNVDLRGGVATLGGWLRAAAAGGRRGAGTRQAAGSSTAVGRMWARMRTWRIRIPRNPPLIAGVTILGLLILGSIIIPAVWIDSAHTPLPNDALQGPSLRHPFGTDGSGFDVFVRVFHAPRIDFTIPVLGVCIGAFIGVTIGIFAGFSRGWVGEMVMRVTDVVQGFPMFILALALVSLSGKGLQSVVVALAFVNVPYFLRLVRSRVLTIRELRFVEAAEAIGNSRTRLIIKHVLPNSLGPAIVQLGLSLGYGILSVAGLAFLGVGVAVPTPEWGSMILSGRGSIITGQWWTVVFPGLALIVAVAGFNLLAEGSEQARELTSRGRTTREGARRRRGRGAAGPGLAGPAVEGAAIPVVPMGGERTP